MTALPEWYCWVTTPTRGWCPQPHGRSAHAADYRIGVHAADDDVVLFGVSIPSARHLHVGSVVEGVFNVGDALDLKRFIHAE